MPIGLPSSPTTGQQYPVVSPIWEYDGAKWVAIAGTTGTATPITDRLTSLLATDDFIALRADVPYLVAASVVDAGPVAATAPAALTVGQWTAEATVTPGEIGINIATLPANGGSAITALEYRVGAGAAVALTGTATGLRVVTAGFSAGVAADIQVRAVNAVGAGAWSDTKNRTPLAAGGGALDVVNTTLGEAYGSVLTLTIPAVGVGNSLVVATFNSLDGITVDGGTQDAILDGLYDAPTHFFRIENITDGRTSVTVRCLVAAVPTDTLLTWAVIEVNSAAITPASTAQVEGPSNSSSISVAYTTTAADALALGLCVYDNSPTTTTGTGGAVAVDQAGGSGALLYQEAVGTAGAKTLTATMSVARSRSTVVLAYSAG